VFTIPKPVKEQHAFFGKDQVLRIKDLQNPEKKMSKSDESGKGVIFLTDTPEKAEAKIKSATTDSIGSINYDKVNQPGISNLVDILALLTNRSTQDVLGEYQGHTQYGPFKESVSEAVKSFLSDFQTKLEAVEYSAIEEKLQSSEILMNKRAGETLYKAQIAVGLRG
jgi:tryptophanyl-tRNA synthetase